MSNLTIVLIAILLTVILLRVHYWLMCKQTKEILNSLKEQRKLNREYRRFYEGE